MACTPSISLADTPAIFSTTDSAIDVFPRGVTSSERRGCTDPLARRGGLRGTGVPDACRPPLVADALSVDESAGESVSFDGICTPRVAGTATGRTLAREGLDRGLCPAGV